MFIKKFLVHTSNKMLSDFHQCAVFLSLSLPISVYIHVLRVEKKNSKLKRMLHYMIRSFQQHSELLTYFFLLLITSTFCYHISLRSLIVVHSHKSLYDMKDSSFVRIIIKKELIFFGVFNKYKNMTKAPISQYVCAKSRAR